MEKGYGKEGADLIGQASSGSFRMEKKHLTRYWAESTKKKIQDSKINEWREQFPILNEYDDKDLAIWREAFNKMDRDNDNFISHADLQKSDWSLEKYNLFQNYDMDQNNLIDFGEFIQAVIDIDTQHFKNFFQGFSKIDIELEFQKYASKGTTGLGRGAYPTTTHLCMRCHPPLRIITFFFFFLHPTRSHRKGREQTGHPPDEAHANAQRQGVHMRHTHRLTEAIRRDGF